MHSWTNNGSLRQKIIMGNINFAKKKKETFLKNTITQEEIMCLFNHVLTHNAILVYSLDSSNLQSFLLTVRFLYNS